MTHVPSRHWGARILKDSHRGYGGFVLKAGKHSVYHAGDTAYFAGFNEIGQRLAPELALLPIGAYNPPQFRNVHADPADATKAFLDLKSRWMVPMHYGTFRLSHEPVDEPLQLLDQEARAAGIKDRVVVHGRRRHQLLLNSAEEPRHHDLLSSIDLSAQLQGSILSATVSTIVSRTLACWCRLDRSKFQPRRLPCL